MVEKLASQNDVDGVVAYDEVWSFAQAAAVKQRAVATESAPRVVAYDQITSLAEAAEIKRAAAVDFAAGSWRGDLWANVPDSITWANMDPISPPASIIFNIRDNGQVWTYTFLSNLLPPANGSWHANLWGNVPSAIGFAYQSPLSEPGRIVFDIRDNGQVWTWAFL